MQNIAQPKVNTCISSAKASRLFWLGRYAERVYVVLHLLRKHYDLMIDEDENSYKSFCTQLGIENRYLSADDFMYKYLHDASNPDSVISMLERVNDNAIMLREEITSETLSYIQLSICYLKEAHIDGKPLNELQLITDYMLAFWGSVDERVLNLEIRNTLKFGKYLECADLHIRFNYSFHRVFQIIALMNESVRKDCYICNQQSWLLLQKEITEENYQGKKAIMLLNGLFCA